MDALFAMAQHLLFMLIGGTGPAHIGSGLVETTYTGLFSPIWAFMITQPILLIGLGVFVLGVTFMVGRKAFGMIRS